MVSLLLVLALCGLLGVVAAVRLDLPHPGWPPAVLDRLPDRVRELLPYGLFLGGVLAVNQVARRLGPEISWIIGWNVTGVIYAVEGEFVAWVQSVASPPLTVFFSAAYLVGYSLLLVVPVVAYARLPDLARLKETVVAYGLNYLVGLVLYVLLISYGPRNLMPGRVDSLLYVTFPRTQLVTSQVNSNTNVFPSLHASLSTTVAIQAWHTRSAYGWWAATAVPLAVCVVVSTMYLGIHWATDVVAGIALGAAAVRGGRAVVERYH